MPDERENSANSRVLLQQDAKDRVRDLVAELNEQLAIVASLGLHPEIGVHARKRTTGMNEDSGLTDISVSPSEVAVPVVSVSFHDLGPTASVVAMRKSRGA
jgi:hypothetical protein